jgi:very-short-patch-repair endonuclease
MGERAWARPLASLTTASFSPEGERARVRGQVPMEQFQSKKALHTRARRLRQCQTDAERRLWTSLRARRCAGAKFRRQYPIGPFIVDFCRIPAGLVIELDGGQHALQREQDCRRTIWPYPTGVSCVTLLESRGARRSGGSSGTHLGSTGGPSPQPSPRGRGSTKAGKREIGEHGKELWQS